MYTRKLSAAPVLFKRFRNQFILYFIYVSAIYVVYHFLGFAAIDIKMSIATVLGFSVSLLLGFRTVASYDRWWEARKVWGGIVNDSRTIIRQAIGFTGNGETLTEIKKLAHYMIAWCYVLRNSLREQDPLQETDSYLTAEENASLSALSNKHNGVLSYMELEIAKMRESNNIDGFQQVAMDNTLKDLCDHMGKCERIKNTVFPEHYLAYTHWGIWIFLIMLPYGMLYSTGPFVIVICMIVNYFFLLLESIAFALQNPFNNEDSDTPMSALSRTIEINLLEMIEEEHDLQPLLPDERGFLM